MPIAFANHDRATTTASETVSGTRYRNKIGLNKVNPILDKLGKPGD